MTDTRNYKKRRALPEAVVIVRHEARLINTELQFFLNNELSVDKHVSPLRLVGLLITSDFLKVMFLGWYKNKNKTRCPLP